ncbi:MAG: HEPN domain-containing protein [Propionibacteriales bacterium]|nr:HEPN domain-containing protein [Propionibacteriales bacterium]
MTRPGSAELEHARQEIAAVRALLDLGFNAQAVSRAYYAAFYAAEAALQALGQSRSRHAGVVAAFGQYLVLEGRLDRDHGRALNTLLERRNRADYTHEAVGVEEARAAVADAEDVVDAVADWLSKPAP